MTDTNISDDASAIHKIAYEQGLISLNAQESGLTAIRQRATALISISGLAATLLGREALKNPSGKVLWLNMGMYEWLALVCLFVSVVCTIQILRPRNGWTFYNSPSLIINQFARGEKATDLSTTYKVLAEFSEDHYKKNSEMLDPLYTWFNVSLVMVVLQIVLWLLAIR